MVFCTGSWKVGILGCLFVCLLIFWAGKMAVVAFMGIGDGMDSGVRGMELDGMDWGDSRFW